MRYYLAAAFLLVAPFALAEGPTLKEARQRLLRGNYEEAREAYEELAKDAKTRGAAAIGLSKCLQSKGEYDKALEAVEAAIKDEARSADLLARKAELLHSRGRWADAEKAAEAALAVSKDHLLGRWVRAQVYRDRGDVSKADVELRWVVKYYTQRSNEDKDITDPDELLIVGLAGSEYARWHSVSDQFTFILNEVYGDAIKQDKDFWPAEYQAGMLLLEKYNRGEAQSAFDKALTINPQSAEALAGRAALALERFDVKEAESFAERALKVNPNLPDALQVLADLHIVAGDIPDAMKELETARKVNPRDESTLGRVAACLYIQRKQDEFDALVKDVEKADPKAGLFYHEMASGLDGRRWFDDAEKFYKKAIDLRPNLPWPRNGLGLLYMRMGREKDGRAILDKAFAADPFNIRVSNMRKVLRHLDKYEAIKTAHFEIRYDPKSDKPLAGYMADYLEEQYAELAELFRFKATGPILIEVFNNHEMFSGRVTALPDLHTIGACTGKMFAMVSPNSKDMRRPFNWARVLRHELVHIFNLEQTRYQVPHWLTEGLAVIQEKFPRPQPWNQLLLERVPKGELMTLDNILMGFVRPKSPADWHMAYCQSQLYVEYMKQKYGPQTVGAMLDAYRDGLDDGAAVQKVCKVDKATFEKGYREFLEETLKSIKGKPPEKAMTFVQLKEAVQKNPEDADLSARLAEQFLNRKEKNEARKLADRVLKEKKNHPIACYVKAKLLQQGGDEEGAQELLEAGLDQQNPEPKVLRELGKLYYDAGDLKKATEIFELGRKVEPLDSEWLVRLARVYAQTGDKDRQIEALKELVPTDADDLDNRKRLAKLLLEAGRHAEAEKYGRQALEIDFRDKEVRETVLKALEEQKKDAEAEKLRKLLES